MTLREIVVNGLDSATPVVSIWAYVAVAAIVIILVLLLFRYGPLLVWGK
jgi:hypothetical protein